MVRYAEIARQHWQKHLPDQFAAPPDADRFFRDLEEEAQRQVDAMTLDEVCTSTFTFAERSTLYTQRRQMAEEIVLRDLLLPPTARNHG